MYEERNRKIKENGKATRERRSQMDCRVISVKVQDNRLSRAKEEKLNRCFLEGKWLYNAVVATDSLSLEDTSKVQIKVNGTFEIRELNTLSAQMKQSVVDSVKTNVSNLSKAKKKGLKVGRLQYKKECNEINLKQFGQTYSIKGKNKISIQKIGVLVVSGLKQINVDEVEFANAKLIKKPSGFYIHLTVYSKKQSQPTTEKEVLGLDMGIKDQLTFSNGVKVNFHLGESEQLKGLMRKLSRQHKGSNQYKQTVNPLPLGKHVGSNPTVGAFIYKQEGVTYWEDIQYHQKRKRR